MTNARLLGPVSAPPAIPDCSEPRGLRPVPVKARANNSRAFAVKSGAKIVSTADHSVRVDGTALQRLIDFRRRAVGTGVAPSSASTRPPSRAIRYEDPEGLRVRGSLNL